MDKLYLPVFVGLMSEPVTHYVCGHRGFPTVAGGKKKKNEKPSSTLRLGKMYSSVDSRPVGSVVVNNRQ